MNKKIKIMKSPITGNEMELRKEPRTLEYKNQLFEIIFHCYYCIDSKEKFTSTELDEINMSQLYEQYNDKK